MSKSLRITVVDTNQDSHEFISTGLHEDYEYQANQYTGELIVERVAYGPRGTDEWARLSATVIAAWHDSTWRSVTLHSSNAR